MSQDSASDKYSEKEAKERFEAALRGARIAGHKPMKAQTKKAAKQVAKPRRKR